MSKGPFDSLTDSEIFGALHGVIDEMLRRKLLRSWRFLFSDGALFSGKALLYDKAKQ